MISKAFKRKGIKKERRRGSVSTVRDIDMFSGMPVSVFLLLGSIYEKHAEVFRVPCTCMYVGMIMVFEFGEGRGKNGDRELLRMGDNLVFECYLGRVIRYWMKNILYWRWRWHNGRLWEGLGTRGGWTTFRWGGDC